MALIKCPECGKEISDRASSCPNCGCPISQTTQADSKYHVSSEGYNTPHATPDYSVQEEPEESFWSSEMLAILLTLSIWPIGLYLMWKYKHFSKGARIVWTVGIIGFIAFVLWLKYYSANSRGIY